MVQLFTNSQLRAARQPIAGNSLIENDYRKALNLEEIKAIKIFHFLAFLALGDVTNFIKKAW